MQQRRAVRRRTGLLRRGLAALALLLVAAEARGDGGVLCATEHSGALVVSVFTAPVPPRVGRLDVSVLVQDADDRAPILDADVDLAMRGAETEHTAIADHTAATNKLLYAATFDVPTAGRWTVAARARAGARRATAACALDVAPPPSPVVAFWFYLALPFAVGALFAVHQWLKAAR